jgi:hypothetical protein
VVKHVPAAVTSILKHGFALAIEARSFNPPEVQAVFVLPESGGSKGKLTSLYKSILLVSGAEPKKIQGGGMQMDFFKEGPVQLAFGSDGANAVLAIGNVDPASVMERRNKFNITKSPLYKEVSTFKEFTTASRGYLDVAGLAKMAKTVAPQAERLIDDLGITGLKGITFHSGFDGPAQRSVVDFHMPSPRKGLLALTKSSKFSLNDLPPLPHDIRGFTAASFDGPAIYDALTNTGEAAVRVFSPEVADFVKEGIKQTEALIGVNLRDDLLGSLDNIVVTYNSPSESPFLNLASVTLIKVKDEKKLIEAAQKIQKNFPAIPMLDLEVVHRKFRGVDLVEVHLGPSVTTMTFTIHKGWLVVCNYPQPVHGFIMRTQGDLPTFKIDAKLEKALAAFPKEFNSISVSDPAPGLQLVVALAPPILSVANGAIKQFVPGVKTFDVSLVPHPLEATRHLFPTITITSDDGKRLRFDSRSSIGF